MDPYAGTRLPDRKQWSRTQPLSGPQLTRQTPLDPFGSRGRIAACNVVLVGDSETHAGALGASQPAESDGSRNSSTESRQRHFLALLPCPFAGATMSSTVSVDGRLPG